MEGYNLTPDMYRMAKKYGMADVRYLIYANLRAVGMSIRNSWMVAFNGTGINWDKNTLEREMNRLESHDSVQKRINDIQGKLHDENKEEQLSAEELARETSKEKILADLIKSRRKYKEGSKEWTEQTKLIAEYSRIKQDDIQTEDTTVHMFLPARYPNKCSECLLYKAGKAERAREK